MPKHQVGKNSHKSKQRRPRASYAEPNPPAPPARKPNWRAGVGQFVSASFSAAAIALREKLGLNTETNVIDTVLGGTALTTTLAQYDGGPTIPIGATAGTGQRIGRSIRIVRQVCTGFVEIAATTTAWGPVRVMAVFNPSQDGAPLGVSAVLAVTTNPISQTSPNLPSYNGTVIFDRTFILGGLAGGVLSSAHPQRHDFAFQFSPSDWDMLWPAGDTAGTAAAQTAGQVQIFAIYGTMGTAAPTIQLYNRWEYVDN